MALTGHETGCLLSVHIANSGANINKFTKTTLIHSTSTVQTVDDPFLRDPTQSKWGIEACAFKKPVKKEE